MSAAFSELPLALFTTLASIGAGAFITLAVAFFTTKLPTDVLKHIDKFTVVPCAVVLVGFIAAFFHLANPAAAFGVFGGLGRSPLSNELCVAVIFALVMIVYVVVGLMGKYAGASCPARKGLSAALAVLAIVFAIFMGLAYGIETIPTWNSPWPVVQMLGYALVGGAALGTLVIAMGGGLKDALEGSFKTAVMAIAVVGAVLAVAGLGMMVSGASGLSNATASGAALVSDAMMCLVLAIVCLAASAVVTIMALRGKQGVALAGLASVLALAGVLAGRFVFYALQISVGLFF